MLLQAAKRHHLHGLQSDQGFNERTLTKTLTRLSAFLGKERCRVVGAMGRKNATMLAVDKLQGVATTARIDMCYVCARTIF